MIGDEYKIWIEAEVWEERQWDIYNDNIDVIVEFDCGDRWIASFFTYSNINKLTEKNKTTGECLNGKYFWSSDMVLVDEVSRERIAEIIEYLIDGGEFESIFKKCSHE